MNSAVEDILKYIQQCDSFHDNCDCLLDNNECDYLLDYINQLEKDKTAILLDGNSLICANEKMQLKIDQLEEKEELHLNRIDELTDRVVKLETNRDEAIKYIKAYMPSFQNYIASDTEFNAKEILSILERGKE